MSGSFMQKSYERSSVERHPTTERHETILIIDDDYDILNLNQTILEMEGYEVFTAQGASEAFILLEQIPSLNLILLDMKMNEMSGLEFLKKIETDRPDVFKTVPIVFLSGIDYLPTCKASGLIKKPSEIRHFVKAVRQFIDSGPSESVQH
jgi:CheY-like chemotaxis protein